MRTAHFWFDPSCPYTWLTSRWLLEVAKVRPVRVRWHLMSLSVLNEGRDDDPEGDPEGWLWVPVRICAAVLEEYGQEALARLYTALWTVGGGEQEWLGDLHDSLEKAGLPRTLADAGMTTAHDEAIRASTAEAVGLVGTHVGTPVISVSGHGDHHGGGHGHGEMDGDREGERAGAGQARTAFFGPVVSEVPTGEAAARLWDGVLLVASTPGFHELQTSRPPAPGPS
ncbi:disulfide bond formation protein DsbA [Streptomyces abyssalis]|uniref:Disulfide bond formation protein DsbA n=1 Tax=Streptomyces abyssalis TaxID=933944 RepID=A0A1E7JR19_9ACTN|nr:disulfide bond formation protein DsbA [Streptomyces abyssalis]OEU90708.1 disulfide bond formation protein DsbA [Streptomyces abyssalis]